MHSDLKLALGMAAAYFAVILPGMKHKKLKTDTIYFAHRGLHDNHSDAPENTLRAFALACENNYGIELDVQLTKDGKAVVCHDFRLNRICSVDGEVGDYTYEELQQFPVYGTDQRIPLFSEVLKLVDGRVPLIVELKFKDFNNQVCIEADKLLRSYHGPYCVESFQPWALVWYRKNRPEVCRGQLSMNFQRQEGNYGIGQIAMRHLLTNFLTHPDFIAYDVRDKEAFAKNFCRKWCDCPSYAWTVKSPEQLKQCRPYYDAFIFEGFRP